MLRNSLYRLNFKKYQSNLTSHNIKRCCVEQIKYETNNEEQIKKHQIDLKQNEKYENYHYYEDYYFAYCLVGGFVFCVWLAQDESSNRSVTELMILAPFALVIFFPVGMVIAFFSPISIPIAIIAKMTHE